MFQHDWPVLSKQLRLRIINSGRLAIFDLGILFGLMLFGKTQEDVTKLLHNGKWDADPTDEEDTDDESETEDASSDDEDSHDNNANNNLDTPTNLPSNRPQKRQKIEPRHPHRVHFQWRGYNTISGAIQFDPRNRNTGYLDFTSDDATSFEGNILMDVDGMRNALSFQGYRVPGLAGPLTMNWNALSHLDSERAKVPEFMW